MPTLVHVWAVGVELVAWLIWSTGVDDLGVGVPFDFGDEIDNVHTETGDAFVEPETKDIMDGCTYLGIAPVQIRLLGSEEAEIVFLRFLIPLPCRPW